MQRINSLSNENVRRLYEGGATIREIAVRGGVSHAAVSGLLDRMGVERRNKKGAAGDEPARSWCAQCERSVLASEAGACRSQWCKVKAFAHKEAA
jgi:hypothetical protein